MLSHELVQLSVKASLIYLRFISHEVTSLQ